MQNPSDHSNGNNKLHWQLLLLLTIIAYNAVLLVILNVDVRTVLFRSNHRKGKVSIDTASDDDPYLSSEVAQPDKFLSQGDYFTQNYNLGDLFHMPSFRIYDWNLSSRHSESNTFNQCVGKAKSWTLFDAYYHNYTDFDNSRLLNTSHRFPNVTHLRRAVSFYGESLNKRLETKQYRRFLHHLRTVKKNTTLLIHFRGGDKGLDDFWWFRKSVTVVLSMNNFTNVIVMSGIHNETGWMPIRDSLTVTQQGIDWIVSNVTSRGVNCSIHYGKHQLLAMLSYFYS